MKNKLITTIFIICALIFLNSFPENGYAKTPPRKIYMSFILHGNMNYDRYVRTTIWRDFPVIYNNLLDFLDEHPDFKGQLQFSGQTFKSLQQAAPQVILHAMAIHNKGQLNFTGTFYSEPVNVNMDGETNFRCAKLGTSIISDAVGSTDGFYLQERAYHPQLPWILNHSGVSWVPVITGDNTYFPFKLRGMDGSVSACVPVISKINLFDKIREAPANSLITIEEDYEIPQSFTEIYRLVKTFDSSETDIEIEWITVKDYISKFGVQAERYIDHTAKAGNIQHGSYSRWTADPLDIIVQDYTNRAMADFRAALLINSLARSLLNANVDVPFTCSGITLLHDPVTWNIENPGLYPDIEPGFLKRDGQVTILSKAEHLLLWAVNSDAKGWYPLYEKRRERMNSFENSSALSQEVIYRCMDVFAKNIRAEGYERYFLIFNGEPEREKLITLETGSLYDVFDCSTGLKLKSSAIIAGGKCKIEFETLLPAYGYKVVGLKRASETEVYEWNEGSVIGNGDISLSAEDGKVILQYRGIKTELSLDSFKIKALAEVTDGRGDDIWRNAVPYGRTRISVRNALYPQLRIEKQPDWLAHMQQVFTLLPDRVLCEMQFIFPHPALIRKNGDVGGNTFDPRGLTLQIKTGVPGKVFYDIPFGISPHLTDTLSYLCPLSTGILQFNKGGGLAVTVGTGEQGFYTDPEKGEIGIYLGASTTSGPIRDVGMSFDGKTTVKHEPAWYSEPFHGTYSHKLMFFPFGGTWQENHIPAISKSFTQKAYVREFYPVRGAGTLPAEKSLVEINQPGIEITSIDYTGKSLNVRLNEKEGRNSDIQFSVGGYTKRIKVPANGIVDVEFGK